MYVVLSTRIDHLESKVARNQRDLRTAQDHVDKNTEALRAAGTQQLETFKAEITKKVDAAGKQVTRLNDCLPELQAELNGLSISTSDTSGYLTGAYLSNSQQVSRVCSSLLSGGAGPTGQ